MIFAWKSAKNDPVHAQNQKSAQNPHPGIKTDPIPHNLNIYTGPQALTQPNTSQKTAILGIFWYF